MLSYADIILPIPFDSFTYAIPTVFQRKAVRGCRVVVPFGKSKIYTGIVLQVHDQRPEGVDVKEILEVLDDTPVVNELQLQFWRWMAQYYMCPLGDVYKAALPGAMKPHDEAALRESKRRRHVDSASLQPLPSKELHPLSEAQAKALDDIEASFLQHDITLLHGVTSSGKTEIYTHLINKCISEGRQVLYLLPEIALTTQITERLERVFGEKMGVYHSKFSEVQRLNVYKRQVSTQPYSLILGVRSSIFLPFQNLGLVIIDEEHDTSYKQQERAPRYQGRNAAMMLARMAGAKTLLGTATPAFETYHYACRGRYGFVKLTQRYMGLKLPDVQVVDIKEQRRKRLMKGAFSAPLIEEIQQALGRGEQIILFQNRRGFSHFIECKQCGWVPRCPHCDVSLTFHKNTQTLTCHYCGYTTRLPGLCPNCEERGFSNIGLGTERVEEQIGVLFPKATVLRMDLDTAKTRGQYERIISDFSAHKADILIGTQMVTKGLDFSSVSVVGILDANTMLNQPDFRSYERTFHLLSQVAGRAGRKNTSGHVILQTRTADNDVIRQIADGDYWGMFYQQMTERQTFHYPPFVRLIYIYLRHRDNRLLEHLADEMAQRLQCVFGSRVLGPDCPPVSRIQSLHIRKIILKLEPNLPVQQVRQALYNIQQQMTAEPAAKNLNIYYDVDPM